MNREQRDQFQQAIGIGVMVVFLAMVLALVFFAMPAENKEVLLVLAGVLAGSFKDVVGWAFGSSKGSADKADLMKP